MSPQERGMRPLERRYRRVLRLLPPGYRTVWADDMVATYLDSVRTCDPDADEFTLDFGRPGGAEMASIVALAVRLRLGGVGASPRSFAWGEAVRLVGLVGLLVPAAMATANIGVLLWLSGALGWLPGPGDDWPTASPLPTWELTLNTVDVALLPAYVALVLGHRRIAQTVAVLVFLTGPLAIGVRLFTGDVGLGAPTIWTSLVFHGLLVAALVGFHRESPPIPRRPWLAAAPVAVAICGGAVALLFPGWLVLDWEGMWSVAVVVAAAVHLIMPAIGRARPVAWSVALSLLAAGVFVGRALSVAWYAMTPTEARWGVLLQVGVGQAAALIAVGVPLAVVAARGMRRLPDPAAGPAGLATPP